eukprot:TRINITY_DN503_c0_g1_i1.p2 TRINITY_DN503_c0_g1~~TRINITY_DN503_c0_g1_i1.p2  ORF type:complete len:578 (-),score=104.86 TRINITY_DN503_c0_g1_i1:3356-5089(-)
MRYQASHFSPQPLSRSRGRATPFFRLRPAPRLKGIGRFRLFPLFSIKNLTLFLMVFAFMLTWSKQTGFAPSLDLAASQILTPTSQHVFNFSDTLFSHYQGIGASSRTSGTREEIRHDINDTTDAQLAPKETEQTEVKSNSSSLEEDQKDITNENTSERFEEHADREENEGTSKNRVGESKGISENKDTAVNMKAEGSDSEKGNESEAPQEASKQISEDHSGTPLETNIGSNASEKEDEQSSVDDPSSQEKPEPVGTQKPLEEVLNFTPATAINFMHFHKTGGVSFKTSLHKFYYEKVKSNGESVRVKDACYSRQGVEKGESQPSFLMWRCDWIPIQEMSEEERNKLDFTFGHQFWGNGIGTLLNRRDVRSFTIMRHPFDRKVSFYFHFFVREVGRKEEEVTYEEIRDFLLYDKLVINADLGRDLGPNYMAGRLLSDGIEGFVGNESFRYYEVEQDKKYEAAEEALKLVRDYIFVGLQAESGAAKCMLKKVVEMFNKVNGVDNTGLELIDDGAKKLNSGSYSLNAKQIWSRFSAEEKITFDRKERVDLLIYEEGERLFKEHVKLFGCAHRVVEAKYKP